MPAAQLAPVNPLVLAWAREESGWALDEVARKLDVKGDRLAAWEAGARKPTVRQAQNLARLLHDR